MNAPALAELERFAREHIPVADAMQLRFVAFDGTDFTLQAPLSANVNHHGTVFGGSQYAAAAVAGWAVIKLTLEQAGLTGDAVITRAEATYKRPVRADFTLTTRLLDREQFLRRARAHHDASVEVQGEIRDAGRVAMAVQASFYVSVHHDDVDPPQQS